ncbi:MAG: hypothetical protein AAF391_04550 [Bacteroidota bacterium]
MKILVAIFILIVFNGYGQQSMYINKAKQTSIIGVDSLPGNQINETVFELKTENRLLKDRLKRLEFQMALLSNSGSPNISWNNDDASVALFQNTPNPFYEETTIYYKVDGTIEGPVSIWVYTMKGKEVKKYENLPTGFYALRLRNEKLKTGSYLYHLVLQGQIIDSKILMIKKD